MIRKYMMAGVMALMLSSPMGFAADEKECTCDEKCSAECTEGKKKDCGCEACDCGKSEGCKHGKCAHHKHEHEDGDHAHRHKLKTKKAIKAEKKK